MKLPAEEVEEAQLGLAPMLDVVLLLLIFFLVTTSFSAPRIDLELPEALTGEAAASGPLLVSIDAEGSLEVEGERVSPNSLGERIAAHAEENGEAELVVRADGAARHGRVVEVLDLARSRGLTRVGIEVSAPRSGASASERVEEVP